AAAVRHRSARMGRPARRAVQDVAGHLPVHLDPRDAPAPALRPADELRLEGAAAARHPQRARHGDPRGGDPLMPEIPENDGRAGAPAPALNVIEWSPGEDVIVVQRPPKQGASRSAWRAFRETARGLRTTFGRIAEGPSTVQYPEEKVPVYPRFRGRHKLHR